MNTPSGLDQAYERDILNILNLDDKERIRTVTILRWILHAFQPLTFRQLAEALLNEPGDDNRSKEAYTTSFGFRHRTDSNDFDSDGNTKNKSAGRFLTLDEINDFNEDDTVATDF